MSFILSESWDKNANETAQLRGAALPRHAIPSDTPSYHTSVLPGQSIKGSLILPSVHWDGIDSKGAEIGEHYTQYAHVIVSPESFHALEARGIVDESTQIYHNFHDCVEEIKAMNMREHETYLGKYQAGTLSHVASWEQSCGVAQQVRDICTPQNAAAACRIAPA